MSSTRLLMLGMSVLGQSLLLAEDIDVNDLRLKGGVLSDAYKRADPTIVSTSPTYSTVLATDADSNRRAEFEWCHIAFGDGGGLVLGVDLALNRAHFTDSDHQTTLWSPVVDGVVGYALRLTEQLHIETTIFGGIGRSSDDGLGLSALRHGSTYDEYGARLAGYATIAGTYQIGIEVPYRVTRSKPVSSYTGSDGSHEHVTETRRSIGGFACLLVLGMRF